MENAVLSDNEHRDLIQQQIKEWFSARNKLTAELFDRSLSLVNEQGETTRLPQMLLKLGQVSAEDLALCLADILNLKKVSFEDFPATPACSDLIAENFLKQHSVLPLEFTDHTLVLAMLDPSDEFIIKSTKLASGANKVEPVVISKTDLESLYEQFYSDGQSQLGKIADQVETSADDNDTDVDQLRDMASEAPVIRMVNLLIQRACKNNASDIHVEPFHDKLKVRFRCDGLLQDVEAPPAHLSAAIISRIKIMAHMNIAERRLPQDGRIDLRVQGQTIDIRVSSIPTVHGESVVMRLLQRDSQVQDFDSLGLTGEPLSRLKAALNKPNGMILVTGPTGSGKSTTLYTALQGLNTEQRKIITVEDPVEYQLEGVNQIQVRSSIGLDFATTLRSIVRQDPDIIMVGEMRDLETARICVQSALTGHLVLSTLHTNEAAGSITRLLDMGVEDYLLTSTLLCVVSQRLVRKLCQHCAKPYQPMPELLERLSKHSGLNIGPDSTLCEPVGCEHCRNTGYNGRIAICEVLPVDDHIRRQIMQNCDARALQKLAMQQGMHTMYSDGCSKALAGLTTLKEVLRVTQES
ncbi:type II secretion system ATPase GspE [Amphritea japonica]|nr:type II secretion system ATPase GspE [Amphritea japonica]